jgi:hypothetical protein
MHAADTRPCGHQPRRAHPGLGGTRDRRRDRPRAARAHDAHRRRAPRIRKRLQRTRDPAGRHPAAATPRRPRRCPPPAAEQARAVAPPLAPLVEPAPCIDCRFHAEQRRPIRCSDASLHHRFRLERDCFFWTTRARCARRAVAETETAAFNERDSQCVARCHPNWAMTARERLGEIGSARRRREETP